MKALELIIGPMGSVIRASGRTVRCKALVNCLGLMELSMWASSAMISSMAKDSTSSMTERSMSVDGLRVNRMVKVSLYLATKSSLASGKWVSERVDGSRRLQSQTPPSI